MSDRDVDVLESGAICLGANAVCDGFFAECAFRIQSHVHDDHMGDFDRSKGIQDIYLSRETRDLLIAERNADLPYRSNLHGIEHGTAYALADGSILSLVPVRNLVSPCRYYRNEAVGAENRVEWGGARRYLYA